MKSRRFLLSFIVFLSILMNTPAVLCMTPAPIVYVSGNSNGDFNCNGTDDHLQINQALQFVANNSEYTTVHFKGPFTYVINGTLLIGNNTTLEGDSTVVIKLADHAGWDRYIPLIKQINSSGNHEITIKGFKIDGNYENNNNSTSGVISGKNYYDLINLSNCQNIDVHDMYLTNNLGDGLRTHSCSNIKFHDNEAYLLGHDVLSTIKSTDVEAYNNKITCSTNSGLRVYNTNNVSFYDNNITSKEYGSAGIEIQKEGTGYVMDNIEVYNNTIYRTVLSGIWIFGSGSYLNSSANVHVHHNQIYDTGAGSSRREIGGIMSDGFNVTIENNVIDGACGAGIVQKNVYTSSALTGSGYVITARNNIITNTKNSSAGGNGSGISNLLTDTHSFVLQNNCLYNNSGGDYSNVSASSTDIQADPQYANRSNHDYHLKSKVGRWNGSDWVNDSISSPCIDAGDPLSDYSNEPEPNGNRINIGPDGNTIYASKSELTVPVADFEANQTEGIIPLTVQFTDESTSNPTEWEWNFGDGSNSTEQNPVHIFSDIGRYNVTLVATNGNGSSGVKSMNINVNRVLTPPIANFTANKTEGTTPLTVKFTDTSTNSPTGWKWNFGDDQISTVQNPEHTFSKVGVYNVTLVATNVDGSSGTKSMNVTVNRVPTPPVANFTAKQTAPLTVQFNDLSLNEILERTWTFGDDSTSTDANITHAYATAGTYVVNLTVSNADGTNATSKTISVTAATSAPPKASFTAAPLFGRAPLTVKFTDTSTNAASLKWDFGDNSATTTESNPSHTYKTTGFYTAKLTATNGGNSSVTSKTIFVAR